MAVYAPAFNEEHNVQGWFDSAKDADEVVLVDTGSTDKTVQRAQDLAGISPTLRVREAVVSPWRFDEGFNAALSQVSRDIDIAVPLHLDERLQSGWRDELEVAWDRGGRQFTFTYQYAPGLVYTHDRIHARHGYRWKYPAHECPVGPGPRVDTGVRIVQVEEPGNASRTDSLLIYLMLAENPDDSRAQYYSSREFMYQGDWEKARAGFDRYLSNPLSLYDQERSEACRHMARMVWPEQQERWLLRAAAEAPQRREVWADLAVFYRDAGQPEQAAGAAARVLSIAEQTPQNGFHLEDWAWDDAAFTQMLVSGSS